MNLNTRPSREGLSRQTLPATLPRSGSCGGLGATVEAVEADLASLDGVDRLYNSAKRLDRPRRRRFVPDSSLEGDGFELLVPRHGSRRLRRPRRFEIRSVTPSARYDFTGSTGKPPYKSGATLTSAIGHPARRDPARASWTATAAPAQEPRLKPFHQRGVARGLTVARDRAVARCRTQGGVLR